MYVNRTLTGSGLFHLHIGLHHYDDLSVHTFFLRFDGLLYFRKLKGGAYKRCNVMLSKPFSTSKRTEHQCLYGLRAEVSITQRTVSFVPHKDLTSDLSITIIGERKFACL